MNETTAGRTLLVGKTHRRVATGLLLSAASLLTCAVVAESVLRFLPVNNQPVWLSVDSSTPTLRFAANRPFVYSRDWNLRYVNRGRTNNLGWVNAQDYDT